MKLLETKVEALESTVKGIDLDTTSKLATCESDVKAVRDRVANIDSKVDEQVAAIWSCYGDVKAQVSSNEEVRRSSVLNSRA